MQILWGWNRKTRQPAISIVLPELGGYEQANAGPQVQPGDDISSWVQDIVTALIASGLVPASARQRLLDDAQQMYVREGLAWDDQPGKL